MIANGKHCGDLQSVDENLAGGVRISSIINIPNDSTIPEHHEFLYVLDYGSDNCDDKSSGILDGNPQYYDKWDLFNLEISRGGTESLAKLTSESGTHIGYSEVVELRGDGYSIKATRMPNIRISHQSGQATPTRLYVPRIYLIAVENSSNTASSIPKVICCNKMNIFLNHLTVI